MTVEAGRICQDTIFCIVTEGKEWLLKIVLQYKYCIAGWEASWLGKETVSRYNSLYRDSKGLMIGAECIAIHSGVS